MRLALASLFTLALTLAPSAFGADPSWFPQVSCRQAWGGQDKARFDYSRDRDYKSYQARLKSERTIPRAACFKEWTVLVYMAADNDLHPYALWDLHDMEGGFASGNYAGSTLRSDLVVEADTKGRTGVRRFHLFQTPEPFVAAKGKEEFEQRSVEQVRSPVVQLLKESKPRSNHEQTLEAFLDWGMKAYPAKHYAVIVWGHGQGWASGVVKENSGDRSRFVSESDLPIDFANFDFGNETLSPELKGRFGGLAFGDSSDDYLSIPSLQRALGNTAALTLENERKIDLYASDACLMQMTEVSYEIAKSSRYIVGSAQVQSYLGLPYRQLMYELNTGRFGEANALIGKQDEAYLLARLLPTLAKKSLDPARGQQGRADKLGSQTFTMSSLSSDSLQTQLAPSLRYLGARLKVYLNEDPLRKGDLKFLIKKTPNFMGGARELGSFLGLLRLQLEEEANETGTLTQGARTLAEAVDLVRGALQLTTANYAFGSKYQSVSDRLHLLGFKAVGVWIPQTLREYQERSGDFMHSRFYKENAEWAQWLSALYVD